MALLTTMGPSSGRSPHVQENSSPECPYRDSSWKS